MARTFRTTWKADGKLSPQSRDPTLAMVHLPVRFSSLPPEVKANVFQHVAWQEARWRNRIEFLEDTLQASEREKHVDGLSAASLVSKEWRSFASRDRKSVV